MALTFAHFQDFVTFGRLQPYLSQARQKLATMSQEEKIAQVLLVRYPDRNGVAELQKYQFGGYVFFAKDFAGKTADEVREMLSTLQSAAKIPILTAVDEEGGSVVRVSSNPQLAEHQFASPQELYRQGGFQAIRDDVVEKNAVLGGLGLNLNLAPVVDVSTNPDDYMYSRSLGENTGLTAEYARTVILASQGSNVSYTLKHFPGYSDNLDTHVGSSVDQRSYEDIVEHDLPPFQAGIQAGAEAVLVSHNIVSSIDTQNPASLSPAVHELLRNDLNFRGVIITDDIAMGAIAQLSNPTARALAAGNDLIITTDYIRSISELKSALANGTVTDEQLDQAVLRVLAWKYSKGLIIE